MRYIKVINEARILELMARVPTNVVALDCESTDKNPRIAELLSVVISFDGDIAYSIPAKFLPLLTPLKHAKQLILQNFKYDYHLLYLHGLDLLETPFLDTMLMHHLIDETKPHDLDFMVKEEFNDNYKEVFWNTYKEFTDAPEDVALEYECKDAIYTFRLANLFYTRLANRTHLIDHTHALAKALLRTEIEGVRVNKELMLKTKEEMGGRIDTYLPKLREEFSDACNLWEMNKWVRDLEKAKDKCSTAKGKSNSHKSVKRKEFNFGSNPQIQWLLYEHLKLPILKKTEAKKPSTDYDTIEKLCVDYPILQTYKDYIDIKTVYGTFVEGLLERVENDLVFPEFNVNGTKNTRISHKNPNLSNLPTWGPFRNFFLPDEGHKIIGADFAQIEIVVEGHLTKDKNLAKILLEGASKHDITAQGLKIPRDVAKTVNFALGYHCGVRKLAKILKCSQDEAQYQWDKYWELYSGARDLKLLTDAEVDAGLPIKCMTGHIRHFDSKFDQEWMRDAAKRQAYNFKIQGPAGHFMNVAFIRHSERLTNLKIGRALWPVHDEGLASVVAHKAENEIHELVKIMECIGPEYNLTLPLKAKGYGPLDAWSKT